MIFEKRWPKVSAIFITADGTANGVLSIPDTTVLHVKQKIIIKSNTQQPKILQVNRVTSNTTFEVGLPDNNRDIFYREDVSDFTVADAASILAEEQIRPKIGIEDFSRAVYAEEPIVANRSIFVDELGNYYNSGNPLPVNASVSVGDVNVDLDFDKNDPDGANSSNTGAYLRDADGNLITSTNNGLLQQLDTSDAGSQALLAAIDVLLTSINLKLTSIEAGTPDSLGQQVMANSQSVVVASNQSPIPVNATLSDEPIKISGTENGQSGGNEFAIVNNRRLQILAAHDRSQTLVYADFGTKDERITQIDYTSSTIGVGSGFTARKVINYVLDGGKYRPTTISWSLV